MEWKVIPSTNGRYEINEYGVIRNIKRDKIIKSHINRGGYVVVILYVEKNKPKNLSVHRLVAECFIGESDLGVNHIDGNKENNHYSNLEYVTHSENVLHAFRTGLKVPADASLTKHCGEKHGASKITEDIVFQILKLHEEEKIGYIRISKRLGISSAIVDGILCGRTWKETVKKYKTNSK